MTINVLYDNQIFRHQNYGGINRYFCNLIYEFLVNPQFGIRPIINCNVQEIPYLNTLLVRNGSKPEAFNNYLHAEAGVSIDLIHHTFYDLKLSLFSDKLPSVSTIHDFIPEISQQIGKIKLSHRLKKIYIKKSKGLICVSNESKNFLNKNYVTNNQVKVIYHGLNEYFKITEDFNFSLPSKYILFVGNRGGYKNFRFFLNAAAKSSIFNDHYLCLFGGGPLTKGEKKLIQSLKLSKKIIHLGYNEADLPIIYSQAKLLVYPSIFEGFGLPAIESLACGTPVLVPRTAIFLEIIDDLAIYFESNDDCSFISALERNIDYKDKNKLACKEASIQVRNKYSWKKSALQTANFYRKILGIL